MTPTVPTESLAAAPERFLGIAGLYSQAGLRTLQSKHVLVFGVGGVGGWTVEMLARSGVGAITLVDPDEVCISNVNRQITAVDSAMGRPKIEVLGERVATINPRCRITLKQRYLTPDNVADFFEPAADFVVDAIDDVSAKCRLLSYCRGLSIPIVSAGAAGGIKSPWLVKTADFAESYNDLLLARCRKKLRQDHGFPRQGTFGIPCVFSSEKAAPPSVCRDVQGDASDENHWFSEPRRFDCSAGYGSAGFVTATFGNVLAALVVDSLANNG